MSIKRYANGAWQDVTSIKRYSSRAWREITEGKVYKNGAWETIWPEGVKIGRASCRERVYVGFTNNVANAETLATAEI